MGSSYDEYMDDYEASRTVADIDDQRLKQLRNYASWERDNGPAGKLHILDWAAEEITRLREQLAEAEGQEPVGRIVKTTVNAGVCELISHHVAFYRDMAEGEELYTHPAPAKVPGESELVHIGYTNGAQVLYCVANKSGSFYPDTENDSCIPVYMLRTHAHRLESTTNGEVTLDRIKREWDMLKSQGGE